MTRFFLVLSLVSGIALGQVYVRPSKGAPILPFQTLPTGCAAAGWTQAGNMRGCGLWASWPILSVAPYTAVQAGPWDWSSFDSMRVRIYSGGLGKNTSADGGVGDFCYTQNMQYTVSNLGSVVYAEFTKQANSRTMVFHLLDAASFNGPFLTVSARNAQISTDAFAGCPVYFQFTPIPFAPTDTVNVTLLADGGVVVSDPAVSACSSVVQAVYLMDAGPLTIGQAETRSYTILCNSRDNSTGTIRCRADDGGVPAVTVGTVGDALSPGDCINYTNTVSQPIKCIGASTYLTSFECVP